jgi:DNA-binding response OmpR family regulator
MEYTKKVVLVVEDEDVLLRPVSIKLAAEGYKVLSAQNGQEGLLLAKTKKPDLILLDIMLPEMDGISMLKELRKDAWGKTAQVIVFTNMKDDTKVLADVMEHNVTEYLVKNDLSLDQLIAKVQEKLV